MELVGADQVEEALSTCLTEYLPPQQGETRRETRYQRIKTFYAIIGPFLTEEHYMSVVDNKTRSGENKF